MAQVIQNLLDHIQSQPGGLSPQPAILPRKEQLKNPGDVLRLDAAAFILHTEHHRRLGFVPPDEDGFPRIAIFQCVGQKLIEHKPKPLSIAVHNQGFLYVQLGKDTPFNKAGFQFIDAVFRHLPQRNALHMKIILNGIQFIHIQHLIQIILDLCRRLGDLFIVRL